MSDATVNHDCLVARIVNDQKVVLNKGAQDGISNGNRFVVFSIGEEIHDPITGESLGLLENIKGKGEVIHVQDRVSTIAPYEFDMEPRSKNEILSLLQPYYRKELHKVYRDFVNVKVGDYARKIK